MSFPRPITTIKQIEPTSICNLRCSYCIYPTMEREKKHMEVETFDRAIRWVRHFVNEGTQGELSLTGIGESFLHPRIVEFIAKARWAIGPDRMLTISTNGLCLDDEMCMQIAPFKPSIFVSTHRPEKAGPAIEAAKRAGIFQAANTSAATAAFDWAGQVDYFTSAVGRPCAFLLHGWGVVLSDGRMTTCCMDGDGSGVVGTVWDGIGTLGLRPYKLCGPCHEIVPTPDMMPRATFKEVAT